MADANPAVRYTPVPMRRTLLLVATVASIASACAVTQRGEASGTSEVVVGPPLRQGFTIHRPDSTILVSARVTAEGLRDVTVRESAGIVAQSSDRQHVVALEEASLDPWLADASGREQLWESRCHAHEDPPPGCSQVELEAVPFELVTTWQGEGAVSRLPNCDCIGLAYTDRAVFERELGAVDPAQAGSGDATGFRELGDAGDCDFSTDDEGDESDEDDDDRGVRCCEALGSTERTRVGFFAGHLQTLEIDDNGGCSGVHVTDSQVDDLAVIDAAVLDDRTRASEPAVVVDGSMGEIPWQFPLESLDASPAVDAPEDEDEDDDSCTPLDGWLHSLHRGLWVRSNFGTDAVVSCVWHYVTPARPGACPTPADPCGDPAVFHGLIETTSDFWIANDGSLALLWSDPPELWAHVAGSKAPVRVALDVGDPDDATVIGVRHLSDAAPLEAALASKSRPRLAPRAGVDAVVVRPDGDVHDAGDGRAWANHCFAEFKAGRSSAAIAACEWALTVATSAKVRGAVYYSLGRIAETRNQAVAAAAHYRTSLALRDDETTLQALERVLGEP